MNRNKTQHTDITKKQEPLFTCWRSSAPLAKRDQQVPVKRPVRAAGLVYSLCSKGVTLQINSQPSSRESFVFPQHVFVCYQWLVHRHMISSKSAVDRSSDISFHLLIFSLSPPIRWNQDVKGALHLRWSESTLMWW